MLTLLATILKFSILVQACQPRIHVTFSSNEPVRIRKRVIRSIRRNRSATENEPIMNLMKPAKTVVKMSSKNNNKKITKIAWIWKKSNKAA